MSLTLTPHSHSCPLLPPLALDTHTTLTQALELGAHGIRVNTVRPTVVLTDLARKQWDKAALEVIIMFHNS